MKEKEKLPLTKEAQLANFHHILDLADAEAEKFADRRETLRVQRFIEDLRQGNHGYLSDLTLWPRG